MLKFVNKLKTEMDRIRVCKQTVKELEKLSDRELADIGIGRSDIFMIAHETWMEKQKHSVKNKTYIGNMFSTWTRSFTQ